VMIVVAAWESVSRRHSAQGKEPLGAE
jgi:hypothetical protein